MTNALDRAEAYLRSYVNHNAQKLIQVSMAVSDSYLDRRKQVQTKRKELYLSDENIHNKIATLNELEVYFRNQPEQSIIEGLSRAQVQDMKQSYLSIVHELALETKARREFGLRETEDVQRDRDNTQTIDKDSPHQISSNCLQPYEQTPKLSQPKASPINCQQSSYNYHRKVILTLRILQIIGCVASVLGTIYVFYQFWVD